MHIVRLILSIIIKPVQPTYHHINIHMLASMITHVAIPKSNVDIVTWRMKWVGGEKILSPFEVEGDHRRKKTGHFRGPGFSF